MKTPLKHVLWKVVKKCLTQNGYNFTICAAIFKILFLNMIYRFSWILAFTWCMTWCASVRSYSSVYEDKLWTLTFPRNLPKSGCVSIAQNPPKFVLSKNVFKNFLGQAVSVLSEKNWSDVFSQSWRISRDRFLYKHLQTFFRLNAGLLQYLHYK